MGENQGCTKQSYISKVPIIHPPTIEVFRYALPFNHNNLNCPIDPRCIDSSFGLELFFLKHPFLVIKVQKTQQK